MKRSLLFLLLVAAQPAFAQGAAQAGGSNPMVGSARQVYESVKQYIVRAAEQMPEEHYSFRPTPEVRTFGQLLGHIANAQFAFCSTALKEQNPQTENIENARTTKAALIEALRASFQYCDRAYTELTDAAAAEPVRLFGSERPRLGVLILNAAHNNEHYGNIVTYMRIKGLVPPSSQPRS
jgi:uncharacterized damage-inducible protein DinB